MIAQIERFTQYGKQGVTEVFACEQSGSDYFFAHSVTDAVEWAQKLSLFEYAVPQKIKIGTPGVTFIKSAWRQIEPYMKMLECFHEYTHERTVLKIRTVNTIYESTGFQVPHNQD